MFLYLKVFIDTAFLLHKDELYFQLLQFQTKKLSAILENAKPQIVLIMIQKKISLCVDDLFLMVDGFLVDGLEHL